MKRERNIRLRLPRTRWLVSIAAVTVFFVVGASTCGGDNSSSSAQSRQVQRNNSNQERLSKNQPSPQLKFSNERANLLERYKRFNDPNKVGYIYMFSQNGQIVDYSSVKGKISALSSQLDPSNRAECHEHGCTTVDVSEPDGSFGTNGGGVFWFDTQGVYHEWSGPYTFTDQPRQLTQQPVLVVNAP